jgi:hypothetical protein
MASHVTATFPISMTQIALVRFKDVVLSLVKRNSHMGEQAGAVITSAVRVGLLCLKPGHTVLSF